MEIAHRTIMDSLADYEGIVFELEEVQNLLELFDEILSNEAEGVLYEKPWTAENFNRRFPMVKSLLSAIRCQMCTATSKAHDCVYRDYDRLSQVPKEEKT